MTPSPRHLRSGRPAAGTGLEPVALRGLQRGLLAHRALDDQPNRHDGVSDLTNGLRVARRLAFTLAALLLIATSSTPSVALADSRSTFATLGHARLTIDSNLRAPSHLSAWAIDEYLARTTPLPPLGHALKRAESKYEVNALYLLAHAMHETGFGTSYISRRFHNLFGWNAADRDPTGMATRFRTYSASIDYVASQISERYLTPGGQFYGGRPTLRGMRYYATDPLWGPLITHLANGIVLSTLSARGIAFDQPLVGDASTGRAVDVTIKVSSGELPNGLRAAYRFVPVAVVEAGSPGGSVPRLDPIFRLSAGESLRNRLKISVEAPARPGRYRLEVELRDSDGTKLTEYDVPNIPNAGVRVFGSDAVSFKLRQDPAGLTVVVTNEGRRAIPPVGAVPADSAVPADGTAEPAPSLTSLSAWLVGADGTPSLFSTTPLDHEIAPGGTWTTRIAIPDEASLPAVLLLRLEVGGEPGRLGGAPPGVFVVAAAPASGSAARASASRPKSPTSPTPEAADPSARPAATAISLAIAALTPADAVSRLLLNPAWQPPVATARASAGASGAKASLAISVTSPAVRLSYIAVAQPKQPGSVTIRITNTGGAMLMGSTSPNDAELAVDPATVPAAPAASLASSPVSQPADPTTAHAGGHPDGSPVEAFDATAGAVLQVTAVPAWGPARAALFFTIPIGSIGPGEAVDERVTLPPSAVGQSTYLVLARVLPGGEAAPLPATMFWLRSAPPVADEQTPQADPAALESVPAVVTGRAAAASSASSTVVPTASQAADAAMEPMAAAVPITPTVPADGPTANPQPGAAAGSHLGSALVGARRTGVASHLDTAMVHARGTGATIAAVSDARAAGRRFTGDVPLSNGSR